MFDLYARVDYRIGVGALAIALIIAIIVWTIVYIEYRKLVRQRKIDQLIRERAEDSGNESDGDTEELSTMVDMEHVRLLDANDL
nr:vpu protein [Simian-Human immunodeficiency virus]